MIENNIALLEQYEHVLLYGENEGIKEDIKNKIKEKNKDSEIIIFFQEEIMNNKNILSEQINNSSLFNLKRIIFLHEITDKSYTLDVHKNGYREEDELQGQDMVFYHYSIGDPARKEGIIREDNIPPDNGTWRVFK